MALDFSSQATTKPAGPLDFSANAAPADPAAAAALKDARAYQKKGGVVTQAADALMSGRTLGFSDELAGGIEAARTGLLNAVGKGPGYTAADAYRATRQAMQESAVDYRAQHPVAATGLTITGALKAPLMKAAGGLITGAESLGGAALRSAGVGAGYGAVTGAGTTDGGLIDRSKGAGVGLIAGGAMGAATPVAARGAVGLINRGAAAVSEAASSLGRAVTNSEPGAAAVKVLTPQALQSAKDRALAYVADLTQRSGKTVDDLASHAAEAMGKPITAAEAIGRSAMYQLGTLGKRSGTTPDALEGLLDARRLDAPSRLTSDVSTSLGVHPEAAKGSIDTLVTQGQAKAAPLYNAALSTEGPISNPTLDRLALRPVIQKAAKAVASSMLNAGENPEAHGLVVTGANEAGLPETVTMKAPTAVTWDRIKKAVADQVERHPITNKPLPNSASAGNRDVAVASRDLTGALREAIPGYGDALDASGDYLSHAAAFDRVKGAVFKTQTTAADFAKMWSGFSSSQAEAARASIANDFHQLAQIGRLKPQLFNTPSVRAKLTAAFGPDKTQVLVNRVEQEALLAKGQRMTPGSNSTTGESAFAGEEQDQAHGLIARGAVRALTGDAHGAVRDLGRTVVSGMLAPVRGAATPLAEAARNEVGRLLQLRPSELAAEIRQFQTRAPRIGPRGARVAPAAAAASGGYGASTVNSP
jgi:hypothetical protein